MTKMSKKRKHGAKRSTDRTRHMPYGSFNTPHAQHFKAPQSLETPPDLKRLEQLMFSGIEPTMLYLGDRLFGHITNYLNSLMMVNDAVDLSIVHKRTGSEVLNRFSTNPRINNSPTNKRIYRSSYKRGSLLITITQYNYPPPHVKGVTLILKNVTIHDVLTKSHIHSISRWDIETLDSMPEAESDYYLDQTQNGTRNLDASLEDIFTDIVLAITPYKTA